MSNLYAVNKDRVILYLETSNFYQFSLNRENATFFYLKNFKSNFFVTGIGDVRG